MKNIKNFKDGSYYWVRRHSSTSGDRGNPTVHVPHWEPMLWDAEKQAFYQAGSNCGHRLTALAAIGEIIARREKRVTRKGWIPVRFSRTARKAELVYDDIHLSRKNATRVGHGVPIPCEISWAHQDQLDTDKFARALSPKPQ